jgi:coniferyl-aldehyde dehydrogenase
LALYYYGSREADRNKVLNRTVSGGASVNETLMHIVVENLPFGGIGPSGMGAYHGEYGFQTFSHRKGVFLQNRINGTGILRPPFGRAANAMLRFMLNR